jgi:tRNA-specific adenosine deaminase 1
MTYGLAPDAIARLVVDQFDRLPGKGKPLVRSNGVTEWTVLAGIVIEAEDHAECVSLATGVKATANEALRNSRGEVLHDMHAEILAVRGFNRFLLNECRAVANGMQSEYVVKKDYRFHGKKGLKISLYVSEAPCGDSSMSLVSEGVTDDWKDPLATVSPDGPVRGRDHFLHVGLVRTKPGRRDSPITYSKSCSDKLCLRQFTSLLLGPVACVVSPSEFYLSSLIVPERCFKEEDFVRAFGPKGRVSGGPHIEVGDYKEHFFQYYLSSIEFSHGKKEDRLPSPTSVLFISGISSVHEAILNGVKMGARPFTGKGLSTLCRKELFKLVLELCDKCDSTSYVEWKTRNNPSLYELKQLVYLKLDNWVATMQDDFSL